MLPVCLPVTLIETPVSPDHDAAMVAFALQVYLTLVFPARTASEVVLFGYPEYEFFPWHLLYFDSIRFWSRLPIEWAEVSSDLASIVTLENYVQSLLHPVPLQEVITEFGPLRFG